MVLIFLQNKIRLCAEHLIQCGKLVGYKLGDLAKCSSLKCYHQIKSTGDQVNRIHFRIIVDSLRNLVESHTSLWCYTYLDQRGHFLNACLIPVDQRVVSADDTFLLHRFQLVHDRSLIDTKHECKVFEVDSAVLLYKS